jgi:hypothetical protein
MPGKIVSYMIVNAYVNQETKGHQGKRGVIF